MLKHSPLPALQRGCPVYAIGKGNLIYGVAANHQSFNNILLLGLVVSVSCQSSTTSMLSQVHVPSHRRPSNSSFVGWDARIPLTTAPFSDDVESDPYLLRSRRKG